MKCSSAPSSHCGMPSHIFAHFIRSEHKTSPYLHIAVLDKSETENVSLTLSFNSVFNAHAIIKCDR